MSVTLDTCSRYILEGESWERTGYLTYYVKRSNGERLSTIRLLGVGRVGRRRHGAAALVVALALEGAKVCRLAR